MCVCTFGVACMHAYARVGILEWRCSDNGGGGSGGGGGGGGDAVAAVARQCRRDVCILAENAMVKQQLPQSPLRYYIYGGTPPRALLFVISQLLFLAFLAFCVYHF